MTSKIQGYNILNDRDQCHGPIANISPIPITTFEKDLENSMKKFMECSFGNLIFPIFRIKFERLILSVNGMLFQLLFEV